MNRFEKKNRALPLVKFLPVLLFCMITGLFLAGLSSVSRITAENEADSLKQTIIRSAVHCYAVEGFYPDSMTYLEEHYGITYDKDRYVISYESIGSNLMPDVTVIPLKKKGD